MLLPARKSPLLLPLYARYGRRLLRRAFARVWVGGAPWPDAGAGPVIGFLNHSAWWDPIVLLFLSHDVFRCDGFGLMQGEQLRRFPFFRQIGCFGATGDGIDDARAVVAHASALLRDAPGRTLWIFPQGALLPARVPLAFRSGLARLQHAVPEAVVVPVALRYELRAEQRPELFVRVGAPVAPEPGPPALAGAMRAAAHRTRRLERALRDELARLDGDLLDPSPSGYRVVLEGRGSLSAMWERTAGRLVLARDVADVHEQRRNR
ncbi:lysophospholipid acyltransferase family protein [Roseisolibacter agri]|uniref:Glycerol acyltransferase n=1 Tax=Roseisolibacter agri TaxID=2014610 RepID=A0AA37Q864_9BACT|nr:lysophospholipid acyltransferase family protein [Roseisolibacter agri]GLC28355.1 glycerol acyltransferase [Roseisolibacter agri]